MPQGAHQVQACSVSREYLLLLIFSTTKLTLSILTVLSLFILARQKILAQRPLAFLSILLTSLPACLSKACNSECLARLEDALPPPLSFAGAPSFHPLVLLQRILLGDTLTCLVGSISRAEGSGYMGPYEQSLGVSCVTI
jgi:hypothetical protein